MPRGARPMLLSAAIALMLHGLSAVPAALPIAAAQRPDHRGVAPDAFNFTARMRRSEMYAEMRRVLSLPANTTLQELLATARRRVRRPEMPAAAPRRWRLPPGHAPGRHTAGCGQPPLRTGRHTIVVQDPVAGPIERVFEVHVPSGYDADQRHPVILDFHAWGWSAADQRETNGMDELADERGAIVIYPEGEDDSYPRDYGAYSWNAVGTTTWRNSSLGPTCEWYPQSAEYPCHSSCRALHGCEALDETGASGCDCSSCVSDDQFIVTLLDHVEQRMCVDTRRVHATGMSNGGLMVYEVATGANSALAARLASIAPTAGAPLMGFNHGPPRGAGAVALLDVRGFIDNVVPANVSNGYPHPWLPASPGPHDSAISSDGFYYTPVSNISDSWAQRLGCAGRAEHFPTRFDGIEQFYCVAPHGRDCRRAEDGARGEVVRCFHSGGHTWPWSIQMILGEHLYANLVFDFFEAHPQHTPPAPAH